MAARNAPAAPAPAAEVTDAAMIGVLLRMVCRLTLRLACAGGAASFRQIAVHELGIARQQDVDVIDVWIDSHPGA